MVEVSKASLIAFAPLSAVNNRVLPISSLIVIRLISKPFFITNSSFVSLFVAFFKGDKLSSSTI